MVLIAGAGSAAAILLTRDGAPSAVATEQTPETQVRQEPAASASPIGESEPAAGPIEEAGSTRIVVARSGVSLVPLFRSGRKGRCFTNRTNPESALLVLGRRYAAGFIQCGGHEPPEQTASGRYSFRQPTNLTPAGRIVAFEGTAVIDETVGARPARLTFEITYDGKPVCTATASQGHPSPFRCTLDEPLAADFSRLAVEQHTKPDSYFIWAGVIDPVAVVDATTTLEGEDATVAAVVDGDTIRLEDGRRVRLVQIDAPEVGDGECYSRKSARTLREIIPPGTPIVLTRDPLLDDEDQYGRLLRYLWKGDTNINLAIVKRGAASVWFYEGERGTFAADLLHAARTAKAAEIGLWQACRGTILDPLHAIKATSELPDQPPPGPQPALEPTPESAGTSSDATSCDPSYPDFCITSPPPDLNCDDVDGTHFTVRQPDPHGFDGNEDGVGCES